LQCSAERDVSALGYRAPAESAAAKVAEQKINLPITPAGGRVFVRMSGVILGIEIFVGFLIGGLLLAGLVVAGPYLVFCACLAWHLSVEPLRALSRMVFHVAKEMQWVAAVVTAAFLYTWAAYKLGQSHRPLAEHMADAMGIAAGLAILGIGVWLIVRIVRRGLADQ
jgi:hypothetical protein